MEEITIKLDIPSEFEKEFRSALAKALRNLTIDMEFAIADSLLSKSELTNEQVKELAEEVDKRVAKKLGS
tara:strand:- start:124 stop:333 length:210 start_codon:yes stop_codon:yes gene_type:complete